MTYLFKLSIDPYDVHETRLSNLRESYKKSTYRVISIEPSPMPSYYDSLHKRSQFHYSDYYYAPCMDGRGGYVEPLGEIHIWLDPNIDQGTQLGKDLVIQFKSFYREKRIQDILCEL